MAKPGQKPQCLALMTVHPNTTVSVVQLLGNAPVCQRSMARVHATRIVLQKLWSTAPTSRAMHFWLDYTDGTVMSQDMFDYLQYPVLTFGKGHDDHCSMPIPQLYHLLAMIGSDEALLDEYAHAVSTHEVGFAKKITKVLSEEYPTEPWERKTPKAIYRGSCYPTANPDASDASTYLFLRGAVCSAATQDPKYAPLFDVGTPIDPAYAGGDNVGYCGHKGEPGNFFQKLCSGCQACNTSRPMGREDMVNYKYQISVDGYGPTFDAIFWKLRSNSVVMHIVQSTEGTQPHFFYLSWYTGLLRAWIHYIPVTHASMRSEVLHCRQHDLECRAIAANGKDLVKCSMGMEVQRMYLMHVQRLLAEVEAGIANAH